MNATVSAAVHHARADKCAGVQGITLLRKLSLNRRLNAGFEGSASDDGAQEAKQPGLDG